MAQSFSLKRYLSKLHAHQLLTELAQAHGEQILLDIGEQTPRKLAIQMMTEAITSLPVEPRLALLKDLSYVSSITSTHTASLAKKCFFKETGKLFEPEVPCDHDTDTVLYFFSRHSDITDRLAFLAPFYASKSYFGYEAKNTTEEEADIKMTELTREYTRLANKDDNATEQHTEYYFLDGVLYVNASFQGAYTTESGMRADTGEVDRKRVSRKLEVVRIVYLPREETVLIAGTVSKQDKLIFLDTFLRIVCGGGYEEKEEQYSLSPFTNLAFDFVPYNKGTPFIKAAIKSITLSYNDGTKKIRIALPSSREHSNMQALKETLDELGLTERFASCEIVNITFGFMFQNTEHTDKSVNVSCSISPGKATLCPLFEYERYTKSLLKNALVYEGFVVKEK